MAERQFQALRKGPKRASKSAVVAGLGIALLAVAVVVWFLRNHIIERLSGPALAQFGLEITDVSLDALATRDATIGYLELKHTSGATIAIENLLLAVRSSTDGRRRYKADRVIVTLGDGNTQTTMDAAALIRQLLVLPESAPAIDVEIEELTPGELPPISTVSLSFREERQMLSFRLALGRVKLESRRIAETEFAANLDLTTNDGLQQRIVANIKDRDDGININVDAETNLAEWQGLLQQIPVSLPAIEIEPGPAKLVLSADILNHSAFADAIWELALDAAVIRVPGGDWPELDVTLQEIACQNGIKCSMQASVAAGDIMLAVGQAKSIEVTGSVKAEIGPEGLEASLAPGTKLSADRIVLAATSIDRIDAIIQSSTSLSYAESGWRIAFDTLNAQVDTLTIANFTTSGSVDLEDIILLADGDDFSAQAEFSVPAVAIASSSFVMNLPKFEGDLKLDRQQLSASFETIGLDEDGTIVLSLDTGTGSGSARLGGITHSFSTRRLSRVVTSALPDFDLTAGSARLAGSLTFRDWEPTAGILSTKLVGVAGFISSIVFTGVATDVDLEYDASAGLRAQPADVSVDLVDIGVALTDLTARYLLHLPELSVDVSELQLAAFGGTARIEPFSVGADASSQTVLVNLESLDLAELLAVKDFAAVELAGRVNGRIPVTIGADGIRIEDGRIDGVAPGGVIRYQQSSPDSGSSATGMGIAAKALSNFEYETLASDVNYLENGDLVLQMQIRGRNPDLEGGRPIVLNLGVENNIPEMLRSLQATRNIQDVLERQVNR